MFKHTIVITGITLLSALGAAARTATTPADNYVAASGPGSGSIEMIVIGLAGLIWLTRRRVFKALGRN